MCSFHCSEDLSTCGEGGIRTHGGHEDHNGFRDRPIQPLWHLSSGRSVLYQVKLYPEHGKPGECIYHLASFEQSRLSLVIEEFPGKNILSFYQHRIKTVG